jgi:hypothetical protein
MDYFVGNMEQLTRNNNNYRKVLFTTPTLQLVLMSLLPGQRSEEKFIRTLHNL